jgi:hypothetical protein
MAATPVVRRGARAWPIALLEAKLEARGTLPGAFTYDEVARGFTLAETAGAKPTDLLAAAMPAARLLNGLVGAPTFVAWITSPGREAWSILLGALHPLAPRDWSRLGSTTRSEVAGAMEELSRPGAGLAAITKTLALLCPRLVPAMPDATVAFLEGGRLPDAADAQTRPASVFVAALDRFADAILSAEPALAPLGRGSSLSSAQILDRALWFESAGYRAMHTPDGVGWWWVADGDREAVVPVGEPWSEPPGDWTRVDLAALSPSPWRDAAAVALDVAWEPGSA